MTDSQRFNPNHALSGTAGGQFTSGSSGGGSAKPAAGHAGHTGHTAVKPSAHPAGPPRHTLAYDPKKNTGAGYGMPHGDPNVKQLQTVLNRLGLKDSHGKPLAVDGKLGPLTTSSIKALQTRLGVTADGQVSPAFFAQVLALKTLPAHRSVDLAVRGVQTLHEGATERLHQYWVHGEGAAKIAWGSPGDFDRCVGLLSKYIGDAKGYCNLAHHSALGFYPATHAKMEGKHRDADLPYFTADDLEWLHSQVALTGPGLDERAFLRAQLATSDINNLPDSDFAYIEPGGSKDPTGRTVPRSLRHFPIHDAAHVRNALARIAQGAAFSKEAVPTVKAAAKKMGIDVGTNARPDLGLCVRAFGFEFESRASGGDGRTLEGYAAVFNTPARIRDLKGDFDETILPGAFKRSLGARTPVLQFDHGKDPRIGGVPIGSIDDLSEDTQGLHVRATLYDHPDVERVRQAIAGRSIKGMSFRFGVPDGGDQWSSRGGIDQREIRDADVHELGPVVFPAYDSTSVSVRSMLAQLDPTEHRSLIRELAAELRGAVDLEDFTGRPGTRSPGGGEPGAEPERNAPPETQPHLRQRLDDGALRARGILL